MPSIKNNEPTKNQKITNVAEKQTLFKLIDTLNYRETTIVLKFIKDLKKD